MSSRLLYGWFDQAADVYRVCRYPPDAPVRPSLIVSTLEEVAVLLDRRRASIFWSPPLPNALAREFERMTHGRNSADIRRV